MVPKTFGDNDIWWHVTNGSKNFWWRNKILLSSEIYITKLVYGNMRSPKGSNTEIKIWLLHVWGFITLCMSLRTFTMSSYFRHQVSLSPMLFCHQLSMSPSPFCHQMSMSPSLLCHQMSMSPKARHQMSGYHISVNGNFTPTFRKGYTFAQRVLFQIISWKFPETFETIWNFVNLSRVSTSFLKHAKKSDRIWNLKVPCSVTFLRSHGWRKLSVVQSISTKNYLNENWKCLTRPWGWN